ncbi:hypothetical protein MMPV_000793 [Pyropia vietnamensis]
MAGFGGSGSAAKKRSPKKKAAAASSDGTSGSATAGEDGSTKARPEKLYARLVKDAGAAEHAVLVRSPGGDWKRVGDLAVVETALPSGVSGGVRVHKREILEAAKRTWKELGVAAAKGTTLVIGTRPGVDTAAAEEGKLESGVSEVVKVSLAEVEAVPRGTASAFKPRGRRGDEAYFGKTLKDGRSMPIDTSSSVGLSESARES